jgi:hypothetical protein
VEDNTFYGFSGSLLREISMLKAEISAVASGIGCIEARLDRAGSVINSGHIEEWSRSLDKLEANRPGKNGS